MYQIGAKPRGPRLLRQGGFQTRPYMNRIFAQPADPVCCTAYVSCGTIGPLKLGLLIGVKRKHAATVQPLLQRSQMVPSMPDRHCADRNCYRGRPQQMLLRSI